MLRRLLASNLVLRFLAEGGSRGTAFLLIPLLSWNLGAEAFGHYSQIVAFAFAFVPLVSAGLGFTVIRRLAGEQADRYSLSILLRALLVVTGLSVLLAVGLHLVAGPVFSLVSISPLPWLSLIITGLAWSAAGEALQQEYFRALGLVRRSVLFQFGGAMLLLLLLGLLWLAGQFDLVTVLMVMVLARLLVVTGGLVLAFRESTDRTGPAHKTGIPVFAGIPFMLAGLAEWGGNLGDRLIAGRFLDVLAVADYAGGMMLLSLIIAIGAPVWWLLFPATASALNQGQRPEAATRRYSMIFIELALPVLALLVLVADPVLSLLLDKPVAGMQPVMLLAGLAIFINQLTTGHEYYLVSVSGGKRLMGATLVWVLAGFLLSLILAPVWGLVGIAAGALAGKLGLALTFTLMARRAGFSGMPWAVRDMTLVLGLTVPAGLAGALLAAGIFSGIALFLGIYGAGRGLVFILTRTGQGQSGKVN